MSKMTQRGTVVMPTPWDNVLINSLFLVKLLDFSMNSA